METKNILLLNEIKEATARDNFGHAGFVFEGTRVEFSFTGIDFGTKLSSILPEIFIQALQESGSTILKRIEVLVDMKFKEIEGLAKAEAQTILNQ